MGNPQNLWAARCKALPRYLSIGDKGSLLPALALLIKLAAEPHDAISCSWTTRTGNFFSRGPSARHGCTRSDSEMSDKTLAREYLSGAVAALASKIFFHFRPSTSSAKIHNTHFSLPRRVSDTYYISFSSPSSSPSSLAFFTRLLHSPSSLAFFTHADSDSTAKMLKPHDIL
jgi:hypothetical protein